MTRKEKDYNIPKYVPPELQKLQKKLTAETFQIGSHRIWCLFAPEILFANSIIIEGTDGVIVVDTGASKKAGEYIKKKLEELTDKPVTTIIYTHHHYDHTQGTGKIVTKKQIENDEVTIIAAKNFTQEEITENITTGLIMTWRSSYGYGLFLEQEEQEDFVIGGMMAKPCIGPGAHVKPNFFVDGKLELELHGKKIVLFQTGGEAATELAVYLPEEKILLCADEVYPSLPNLHSLRGTKPRNALNWITAIDSMRKLEIDYLVGNHGKPVTGAEKIQEILLYYRDIIQYQHDQAVRLINNGYTAKELAEELTELPSYLHYPPYSTNYYGDIRHNVPEFFVGYISWFGGDPVELQPTPKKEKAERMVQLIGGREKVLAEGEKAFFKDDPQFGAELATLLVRIDQNDWEARKLKAACFRKLGYQQINSWWRGWYLTSALELEGKLDMDKISADRMAKIRNIDRLASLTIEQIYSRLRYSILPDKAKNNHLIIGFHFTDTEKTFALELRHSILVLLNEIPQEADATLLMERSCFNNIFAKKETILKALLSRKIAIKGKKKAVMKLFQCLNIKINPISLCWRK